MKMNKFILILLSIILISISSLTSCFEDSESDEVDNNVITETKTYVGKLEKGAFQQGAEIIAYGWDEYTGFTGESFATLTNDDLGNYTLKSSKIKDVLYVKAEGYFYNENTGLISDSTLKLYGMVDSTKTPWNINVLTHIIQPRVMYLIENGSDYDTSVNQAITELFAEFNWSIIDPGVQSVSNNGELLLLSAAICKGRTISEISSLLTTLSNDLENGTIDISMIDDDFYNLDVTEIETNMITKYGLSPSLDTIKSDLIAYRGITGPAPKIYTFDNVNGYDFFYKTESGQIKGLNSTNKTIENVSINCLITQSGYSDKTVSVSFQSFYTISGVIYYSALVDSEIKYVSQSGVTVDVIEQGQMLLKPVKDRITLTNIDYTITTDYYDPYVVSDVKPLNGPGSFIRNIMVNDYFIGAWNAIDGIFYVVVDNDNIVRQSGLYFTPEDQGVCQDVLQENGELWKL